MKNKTSFVKWQVYPLPDNYFAVSNLMVTLRAKSEAIASKVARIKNRDLCAS